MAILRNPRKDKFTVVSNDILRDDDLSLKARGLLVTMLSLPNDWQFSENGLDKIFPKDGQAAIRSGLKELEHRKYLTRTRERDEHGRLTKAVWIISDYPQVDNPHLENPSLDYPNLDKPHLENQPQLNTKQSSTNKLSTKGLNTERVRESQSEPPARQVPKPEPVRSRPVALNWFGRFRNVLLSDEEYSEISQMANGEQYIDRLSIHMESTGKKYASHFATLLKWIDEDKKKGGTGNDTGGDQKEDILYGTYL